MQKLSIICLIFLVGCSSAKIQKADKDDFDALEKQFDPVAWQKIQDAKKKKPKPTPQKKEEKKAELNPNKYICIDKMGKGSDKRTIEYFPKEEGMDHCRVEYTKFGKKTIPYKAKKTIEQCKVVFERIPRKLKKAKFKCELQGSLEKKEEAPPAPIPTPQAEAPEKEQEAGPSSQAGTRICKSKTGGDVRTIELIETPNGGCIVEYTKFGTAKNVVEGAPKSTYCKTVYDRIPRKLKAAGFTCTGD